MSHTNTAQDIGASLELELTFLARYLPKEIQGVEGVLLRDIYIPDIAGLHPKLRLRQRGNQFEITKKYPLSESDKSVQQEVTIPLSLQEFEAMSHSSTKTVSKLRYKANINGCCAEIDVFQDLYAGLVLIDFEFSSADEKDAFVPPEVCLADITQQEFIAGGQLAGGSYADIVNKLEPFGYKKIL